MVRPRPTLRRFARIWAAAVTAAAVAASLGAAVLSVPTFKSGASSADFPAPPPPRTPGAPRAHPMAGLAAPDPFSESAAGAAAPVTAATPAARPAAAAAACAESAAATGGLICEPAALWATRKAIYTAQAAKQVVLSSDEDVSEEGWWMNNYEPNFSCAGERRLGRSGDGGKWVCDPGSIAAAAAADARPCVVYSLGSGGDSSFEQGVHAVAPGCVIHTFDHTVGADAGGALRDYIRFHPWAAARADVAGTPQRGLASIRAELGHPPRAGGGTVIDILKVDIEGAEYETLLPWLAAGDLDGVRQLLVEIHSPRRSDRYATTRRLFAELDAAGWVITHKEPNLGICGKMQEYAFLKLDWAV